MVVGGCHWWWWSVGTDSEDGWRVLSETAVGTGHDQWSWSMYDLGGVVWGCTGDVGQLVKGCPLRRWPKDVDNIGNTDSPMKVLRGCCQWLWSLDATSDGDQGIVVWQQWFMDATYNSGQRAPPTKVFKRMPLWQWSKDAVTAGGQRMPPITVVKGCHQRGHCQEWWLGDATNDLAHININGCQSIQQR